MLNNRKGSNLEHNYEQDEEEEDDERIGLICSSSRDANDSNDDSDIVTLSESQHSAVTLKPRTGRHNIDSSKSYELKNLQRNNHRRDNSVNDQSNNYVLYDIRPGDSLANLALRYRCSVARIKELNRILNDQEFYALKQIKLPNGSLGLLSELLNQEQQQQRFTPEASPLSTNRTSVTHSPYSTTIPGCALLFRHDVDDLSSPLTAGMDSSNRLGSNSSFYQNRYHHSDPMIVIDLVSSANNCQQATQLPFMNPSSPNNSINREEEQGHKRSVPTLAGQELLHQTIDEGVLIPELPISQTRVEAIFENLDQHIEHAKASTEWLEQRTAMLVNHITSTSSSLAAGATSDYQLLHDCSTQIAVQQQRRKRNIYACDDADFGLNYRSLVIFIFLVCLIVPLMYVIYIEENSQSKL